MSTKLEDLRKRFDELDELIKRIPNICEKVYIEGYLHGREDSRRDLYIQLEGKIPEKEFDEFERAGFSPEECEGLREIRDRYNFPSEQLINFARESNDDSMKLARLDALLDYAAKK